MNRLRPAGLRNKNPDKNFLFFPTITPGQLLQDSGSTVLNEDLPTPKNTTKEYFFNSLKGLCLCASAQVSQTSTNGHSATGLPGCQLFLEKTLLDLMK